MGCTESALAPLAAWVCLALYSCNGQVLVQGTMDAASPAMASDAGQPTVDTPSDPAAPTTPPAGSMAGIPTASPPATAVDASAPVPAVDAGMTTTTVVDAGTTSTPGIDAGCGSGSVSFSSDVMPIFQQSCTLSSVCHGQVGNASEEDLYLGSNSGGTSPSTVFAGLVGVPSREDPSMNLVTAGNANGSFLWHKLIGDQNTNPAVKSGCAQASSPCSDCTMTMPCGSQEPYLSVPLAGRDLCAIETWIDQGAKNN